MILRRCRWTRRADRKKRSSLRKHINVKTDITEIYERDRAAAAKKTVWYTGGCTSWYLNAAGIPASWPWTYKDFKKEMSKPNLDAFELIE
jgi:hypothetical protein